MSRAGREARFHDDWAAREDVASVSVEAAFGAPTALENRFILERLGDVRGRRVLDVGSGLGEASVKLALLGARVTAADVSPGMLRFARRLASRHGVSIATVACSAEALAFPAESFDVVYLANVVHHAGDRAALFSEVRRVLSPGGRFVSWDPLRYNPAIAAYRLLARAVRSDDERPLGRAELRLARCFFPDVEPRFFWLASQALFLKYFFVDRLGPGQTRYLRRILEETEESLRWWRPLERLDRVLTRIPLLGWLCWNVVLTGTRL